MVCIMGTRDGAGERLRFDRKKVLLAYAGVALPAGLDPLPAFGLGASSPYGPFNAYVKGGEAVAFRTACGGKLTVGGPDDEQYELKVTAVSNDVNKESSGIRASRDEVSKMSVHIVCHLAQGPEFRLVKKRDLKKAFVDAGFVCFLSTRSHVKITEDQKGEVAGTETEDMHLNVRPRFGSFVDANWPVRAFVSVKANKFTDAKRDFFVRYDIKPHEQLPDATFCRVHKEKKVDGKCGRCKAPRDKPDDPKAHKRAKTTRDDVMSAIIAQSQAATMAAGGTAMSPEVMAKTECTRYMDGLCSFVRIGGKCPFLHPPQVPPEMIPCGLFKSKVSGVCRNRSKCLYKGCIQRSAQTPEKEAAPGGKRRMVPRELETTL